MPQQYATLPETLTLREVRVHVTQKGFRTKVLVVVTTLLDAEKVSGRVKSPLCTDDDGKRNSICEA